MKTYSNQQPATSNQQPLIHKIRAAVLLIVVFLLFAGCQKDDNSEIDKTNSSGTQQTIRNLTSKEVKNNKSLFAEIEKFNAPHKSTMSTGEGLPEKFKIGDLYDVNYGYGKEIIDGKHHSYTFPLVSTKISKSPLLLFNMIFSQQEDGSYSKRVVAYKFSREQFEGLQNDIFPTDKINLVSFDPNQDIELEPATTGIPSDPQGCPDGYHLVDIKIYHIGGVTIYDYIYVKNTAEPINTNQTEPGGGGGGSGSITIFIPSYGPPAGSYTPTNPNPVSGGHYQGGGGSTTVTTPVLVDLNEDFVLKNAIQNILELPLGSDEYSWLMNDAVHDQLTDINDFLLVDTHSQVNEDFVKEVIDFYIENGDNEENEAFAKEAMDIKKELPDARFDRIKELNNLIKQNPWVLIQQNAQENGMDTSNYIYLFNHDLPQVCKDKLNTLGDDFENQPLSEGNVPLANIDYYSVEITTNPDFDHDGQPDSANQILKAFRSHFMELASGEKEDFQFSSSAINFTADIHWEFIPYTHTDDLVWHSTLNPVKTIIGIDAGSTNPIVSLTSDLGAIMISEYTNDHFIGSTITTDESGSQPFSGNREWGVLINQNGNLEIYTRAVDVAKVSTLVGLNPFTTDESDELTYYDIADATWKNLQNKVKNWIEDPDSGGQAIISTTKTVKVDKEKIKQLLEGSETIDQMDFN